MKLYELLEKEEQKTIDFVCVKFSKKTLDAIEEYVKRCKVPNPVPRSKLHATLIFSRNPLEGFEVQKKIDPPWIGIPHETSLWLMNHTEEKTDGLVIKFQCQNLYKRHMDIRKNHNGTHDYKVFFPHISVSYDVGKDFCLCKLGPFSDKIEIVSEHFERMTPKND